LDAQANFRGPAKANEQTERPEHEEGEKISGAPGGLTLEQRGILHFQRGETEERVVELLASEGDRVPLKRVASIIKRWQGHPETFDVPAVSES
jgi:hypothetical protein